MPVSKYDPKTVAMNLILRNLLFPCLWPAWGIPPDQTEGAGRAPQQDPAPGDVLARATRPSTGTVWLRLGSFLFSASPDIKTHNNT